MKKIMCLIFILLTSCSLTPESPPPVLTNSSQVSVSSSFVSNQECPHICWLGINPGVTTDREALVLLSSSKQIAVDSLEKNETGARVEWHSMPGISNQARVGMVFENGVVQSINFMFLVPVKIQEFVDLFGEPDEISIRKVQAPDARYIDYFVYYTSKKIVMFVLVASENGPDPSDSISDLYLNINSDDPNAPHWMLDYKDLRQSWLGFGHLDEYLLRAPPELH